MSIEIRIDDLVLHGFPAVDAAAVAEALEGELAALVGERPPGGFASADSVDAGSFDALPGSAGRPLGVAVAARVHQALAGRGGGDSGVTRP